MTSLDEPRPNFRGSMGYDAVTGKLQPQHPRYFTYMKVGTRGGRLFSNIAPFIQASSSGEWGGIYICNPLFDFNLASIF